MQKVLTFQESMLFIQIGRLFEATPESRAYFTPPGCYHGRDSRIDFQANGYCADDVFGTGVEYPIEDIRCGIIWDKETHTHALMLAVCFRSRNPQWTQLKMWTNVARMELQSNRYGRPGKTNYFANFAKKADTRTGSSQTHKHLTKESLEIED